MATEYFLEPTLNDFVNEFVSDEFLSEFGPIQRNSVKFACAYVLKSTDDGEAVPLKGDTVVLKKVGPADKIFFDYHYKIYVDHARWEPANDDQKKAMLHKALMRVCITITDGGGIKFGTRSPDITEFQATVVRFGPWTNELLAFRNNLQAAAEAKKALYAKAGAEEEENAQDAEAAAKQAAEDLVATIKKSGAKLTIVSGSRVAKVA